MSEVIKCDSCGAIYKPEYENIRIVESRRMGQKLNSYDLCPNCVERFHSFIDSSRNKKNPDTETDDDINRNKITEDWLDKEGIRWADNLSTNIRTVYVPPHFTESQKKELEEMWRNMGMPLDLLFLEKGDYDA